MITVKFDRTSYSKIPERIQWLRDNVGAGGYSLIHNKSYRWEISEAFGYSYFSFKRPEDALMFILFWGAGDDGAI